MADRPTLFSGPMVRAIVDGRKTQTRRLASSPLAKCKAGDRLWVRERTMVTVVEAMPEIGIRYAADGTDAMVPFPADRMKQMPVPGKHLSMGCYREASRLTLIVTEVRRQRLQDISEEDAKAEGCGQYTSQTKLRRPFNPDLKGMYSAGFMELWDGLHGHKPGESWADNPEIVALTFEAVRGNIDQIERAA